MGLFDRFQSTPTPYQGSSGTGIPYAPSSGGYGSTGGTGIPYAQTFGGYGSQGLSGAQNFGASAQNAGSKVAGVLGSPGFASGLGAFSTLASIYTGFKGLGLAKDQLNFQKSSFNKNFAASAKAYETDLKDRWAKRSRAAASRGREFEGMDKWVGSRSIKTGKASKNKVGG